MCFILFIEDRKALLTGSSGGATVRTEEAKSEPEPKLVPSQQPPGKPTKKKKRSRSAGLSPSLSGASTSASTSALASLVHNQYSALEPQPQPQDDDSDIDDCVGQAAAEPMSLSILAEVRLSSSGLPTSSSTSGERFGADDSSQVHMPVDSDLLDRGRGSNLRRSSRKKRRLSGDMDMQEVKDPEGAAEVPDLRFSEHNRNSGRSNEMEVEAPENRPTNSFAVGPVGELMIHMDLEHTEGPPAALSDAGADDGDMQDVTLLEGFFIINNWFD